MSIYGNHDENNNLALYVNEMFCDSLSMSVVV